MSKENDDKSIVVFYCKKGVWNFEVFNEEEKRDLLSFDGFRFAELSTIPDAQAFIDRQNKEGRK